jgi:hypothetical protein
MLGYKHTAEAIEKMKKRFVDKTNHPYIRIYKSYK